ncbi:fibrobacter succinogenes major paralogous domain-containing protein [Flavobacterium sp. WC2509]|uniref:fibrobacter succinogenes major paralogous domain-containing protein n=1 Tax=Flavobacterium sp. WC2509 TaxID=3461406 RepID=UPI0040439572
MINSKLICIYIFISLLISSCNSTDTVEDLDGNIYHTTRIGNQTWMVENLKTTRFNNGDLIANIKSNTNWEQSQQAAYSVYNNDSSLIKDYGFLYNYFCLKDSRSIAPKGWRIPTEEDLKELELFINSNSQTGIFLKEKGNTHWLPSNTTGNNATGFNALPGGFRDNEGGFYMLKANGYYWTDNGSFELYHWSARMFQAFADVRRDEVFKQYGFAIKCIKEE